MSSIDMKKDEEIKLKEKSDQSIRKISEESNNSLQTKDTLLEKQINIKLCLVLP